MKQRTGKNQHRGLVFGSTVIAVLLGLASVAYACTAYYGYLYVYGDYNSDVSYRAGDPRETAMTYCATAPKYDGASAYKTGNDDSSADVRVEVGHTDHCVPSELSAFYNDYNVNFYDGRWGNAFDSFGNVAIDCMNAGDWNAQSTGAITVDGSGYDVAYIDLTGSGLQAGSGGAVCVADPGDNQGNQVPITFY